MTLPSPQALLRKVDGVRSVVQADTTAILAGWSTMITDRCDLPALRNLAAYLALRHQDISDIQPALAAYGLSSLGRSEARVMASLDAVRATLARIVASDLPEPGDDAGAGHDYPPPERMLAGEQALLQVQNRFFGADVIGARTRIMVTLPNEAATDRALVRSLIAAGMSCARINCAHDDADTWRAMAAMVRTEAASQQRECRILMDIGGPKCRIETIHADGKVRLFRGDRLVMVGSLDQAQATDAVIATISFPDILDDLAPGQEVWINDGKIGARVIAASGRRVELEVFSARAKGDRLRPEKGVNFPDTELHLSPLSGKDLADLDVIAGLADLVGYSFVQRPRDVTWLAEELARRRPGQDGMPIMLKIETPLAVRNLPRLIVTAAASGPVAVMIARGDLAVELGFARMSEVQEEIMWLCEAASVPVVWATQVLDGLVSNGIPTRAETTDAAMAQRAECVMLNKGPFLAEGVRFLADVLRRMDRHQAKKSARFGPLHSWPPQELSLAGDCQSRSAPPAG